LDLIRRLAGSFWVRVLVSAGLLAVVATQINFGAIRGRLSGGSWGWFAVAVVVLFASFVVGGLRWHIFLRAGAVDTTQSQAVRAYLIGTFTTNFLPTQIGGDVTRAVVAAGPGSRMRSAATVVLDRATALACMIIVGWIFVASNPGAVPGQLFAALAAATAAFLLASAIVSLVFRVRALRRLVPARAVPAAGEARAALAACLTRSILGRTLLIGLAFQGLVYLSSWLVARSISLDVPFSAIGAVLAPVLILSTAPVSIGGFGVREGSFVLLLGYAGVSATDATLFSLLQAAVFALASLPGALVLLRRGARSAPVGTGRDVASDSARPAQPEDRDQERREEDLDSGYEARRGDEGDLALAERAGAAGEPVGDDHDSAHEPRENERTADE
jgi:uncharacterized membrane protein YbhN (UPF0104 family)